MQSFRLVLSLALLATALAPVEAQLRPNRPTTQARILPRLLVATPYAASSADSAAAVRIGESLRRRVDDVAGRWFTTITRDQMNEALLQYAYPADAVLPPSVARTLATQLQARFVVSSTLSRGEGGRYVINLRALGINDRAGYAVTLAQQANQSLEDFGRAGGDALSNTFRALDDAKSCWDQQTAKPQDAVRDAQRALRTQPNHALAAYCLAEIAKSQNASRDTLIKLYQVATEGDPQSLEIWTNLAQLYVAAEDSANVVRTFQQMLRVAPTNQGLREEAFRLFLAYDRPQAAKQVAEEGLAIDSTNADLWDLKSNACLFQEDFPCAIDALEQVYALDTAKADSSFFDKIAVSASQQPDTARLLTWARRGVGKYPDSPTLLAHLATAYGFAGPIDSSVSVIQRLMAVDSSDLRPVLRTIQSAATSSQLDLVEPLVGYIERLGDENDKQTYAQLLLPVLRAMFQHPESLDLEEALALGRRAASMSIPGGRVHQIASYFQGVSAANLLQRYDVEINDQRSCELARRSDTLRTEAEEALTAGQSVSPEFGARALQMAVGYKARIDSQIRAYCR